LSSILPTITDAGLAAAFTAANTGVEAVIASIALGDQAYTPARTRTALGNERDRLPAANGQRISPTQIRFDAVFSGSTEYWVREVGFFLDDGTLFAVWSDPTKALAFKSSLLDLVLSLDLSLAAVPPGSVTILVDNSATGRVALDFDRLRAKVRHSVEGAGKVWSETDAALLTQSIPLLVPSVPDATETIKGKVELATVTEAVTGTDAVRAVTPAGLNAKVSAAVGALGLGTASTKNVGTASGTVPLIGPGGTVADGTLARAWAMFQGNAAGTAPILASRNIFGISHDSLGTYTVTFTTPFATANYVAAGQVHFNIGCGVSVLPSMQLANRVTLSTWAGAAQINISEFTAVMVAFFGDQ